jgi:DNA-binding CsgD family transcriptional regulator
MLDGSGQRLRGRLAGHADLVQCTRLLPPWLVLAEPVRQALPALWTRLLGQPGFNADVIEDLSRPPADRVMGLGMAIALDTRWQQRLRDDPPPFAAAILYAELLESRYQPPGDKALAAMNAAGEVSFLVLHYHQRLHDLNDPDTLQMLAVAMAQFRGAHAGYRLRELYQEGHGPEGAYLQSMGFRCRTQRPQAAGLPQLYGLTRDEAVALLPGTPVRDAFQFTPPRFLFSASERRLLRLATTDLTDEQIGDELGISGHSVKKLLRAIHLRAVDRMPHLFDDPAATEPGTRGPEKRRSLLQYLRQHPEELRPFAVSAAARAAALT